MNSEEDTPTSSLDCLKPRNFHNINLKTKDSDNSTANVQMGTALKKYIIFLKGDAILDLDVDLQRKCENLTRRKTITECR